MQFAALWHLLSTVAGPLVNRILTGLGIGAVSYVGINLMLGQAKSYIVSNFGSLAHNVMLLLGVAKVDIAVNIIFAAVVARAVASGMNKGSGSISGLGSIKRK